MPPGSASPRSPALAGTRRVVFALALASFVLSFFHRTAPAAIAGELTQAFAISGAVLGTLAATYFYVYTLLQIPVGVLADTLGPRKLLTGGSAIAAVGSLLFALAPAWEIAAVGRTLVGIGVSVAFISILKVSAVWFPANRFATLAGMTMFAGNLGAVIAGAPLAWLVTQASWRSVFVGLAVLSALLALASWWRVRDRPEDAGLPAVNQVAPTAARLPWMHAVLRVLANRATWPAFVVNVGVGGSYLTFAGLWAVPYLQQTRGMTRVDAAQHTSLLLLGVAIGSLVIGMVSDRLQSRRGVMRAFVLLYLLSWLPWVLHADWPLAATLGWFLLMGLLIPGFTLSWTIAKEANPVEFAGIATAVVNVGIFLGTGVLQPLVGWVLDRGRASGDLAAAWDQAILVMAGAAALGALASVLVGTRASVKP
ncbi:MAG: MFS transporter [Burkholderiaceae bacterium]